ncbi:hypothetical protein CKK33_06515 [Mucilaginibacter sp. MD40]|uniref:hypothetical protein n=1 Tax=Mucilaginibacter sp. MD40 TaxID=2029590 RepID=UPI000BAC8875|nr:hypothetical protein [Mucilaginibacter sp. MD40]PAW93165.1 hypothetical protein CKK33_06515 [Mucilaginibacter sp. MD40]
MDITKIELQALRYELWRKAYTLIDDKYKKFYEEELDDTILDTKVEMYDEIELKETTGTIFNHLFKRCNIGRNHFNAKIAQLENNKGQLSSLKPPVFISACKFLELKYDDIIKSYQFPFDLNDEPSTIAEVYKKAFVDKLKSTIEEFEAKEGKPGKINNSTPVTKPITPNTSKTLMEYNIEKLVTEFYQCLSSGKIEKAWNMITKRFQKRGWKEKYEDFEIGYVNLLSISDLHIWDIKIEGSTAECKVFYLDKITIHTSVALGNFDKLTVAELDNYVEDMRSLIDKSKTTDLKDFDKIELAKFFEPAVSEYIWYKCGVNPESIIPLLPTERTTTIPRLYNILCSDEDGWRIASIIPIRNHLYR